ncbi:putative membrane protein [Wickerhamomyces ciferrii]|uniref:Membrane protein n=1 Tax=Wickerhamomyces ciferrii (strain ATCC 14091 / BCRC 22168 / CBS 111 / JCM 3599 / NBRC 0793 / NRRL Y-1031 F-60-10) TaxID=1206466 RepID=K0KU66_WICCF|nr:uncharacterized protein BN7_6318 [Wickerhamomyces ciferrii]CCH46721.1 putative membrane protein [Wickerhamomyces ciferrii]
MSDTTSINNDISHHDLSESQTKEHNNTELKNNNIEVSIPVKSGIMHNYRILWMIRWVEFFSSASVVTLSGLSVAYFFRRDGKMAFVLALGAISFVYQSLILYDITWFFNKSNKRLITLRRFVIIFDLILSILWLISFILITIEYPRYECHKQGKNNRVDGCRSGKASIAFSLINFVFYLTGAIVLLFNTNTRLKPRENFKLIPHLLDFEN